MNPKELIRLTAQLEGHAVQLANIGSPVKGATSMEMMVLCNFAEVGLLSLCAELDGDEGEMVERELRRRIESIRTTFAGKGADGITRLMNSAAALLRSDKYGQFLSPLPDDGEGGDSD